MTEPIANYLRIYREQAPETTRPGIDAVASLPAVLAAFREATGWSLQYRRGAKSSPANDPAWSVAVAPGLGVAPGQLALVPAKPGSQETGVCVDSGAAKQLATALAQMLSEILRTQRALWQREAELAAGVPVVSRNDGQKHLAVRLRSVLRGGAEAIGCHAAALYLLDEATTCLKLRSCWGLPPERLTAPPRPLQGALGDLEAMLGHAVVLEDTTRFRQWNVPEDFPGAACVPVATPTTVLGTLWVFSNTPRNLTDRETNVLEIVAGKIGADLEREMLLREGVEAAGLKRQLSAAQRIQQSQLPTTAPMIEGWDLAGWTSGSTSLGASFHDWFPLPDGSLALALGGVDSTGMEAALVANAVRTALRCHASHQPNPAALLQLVSSTLWAGSAGDQAASLFCGVIGSKGDRIRIAAGGRVRALHILPDRWEALSPFPAMVGTEPATTYSLDERTLRPGHALVIFHDRCGVSRDKAAPPIPDNRLAEPLVGKTGLPSRELLTLARDRLMAESPARSDDCAVLVVRRTAP